MIYSGLLSMQIDDSICFEYINFRKNAENRMIHVQRKTIISKQNHLKMFAHSYEFYKEKSIK
jgi:hypothetical protein